MPRKNEYGRYILSAGEVGAFTVCPEAWRLRMLKNLQTTRADSVGEGLAQHAVWAAECDRALNLQQLAFAVVAILAVALIFYALM